MEFCGKAHGYGFGVVNLQVWLLNQLPIRRDLERKAPDANGVNVKGYPDPLNPALKPAEIEYLASVIGDIDLSNPEAGRCRLPISKSVLKAPVVSALETIT